MVRLKDLLAGPVFAGVVLMLVLSFFVGTAEAAKRKGAFPRERVTVLMAQEAVGGKSFKSPAQEIKAVVEAGDLILDDQQRELDEMFAAGKRTALEHAMISDRIEESRRQLPGRVERMVHPGGPVNAVKRVVGKCKAGVVWVCSQPFRLITDEEAAMKIATLVVTGAEFKTRAGRAITGGISELAATEKFLKTTLDEMARLIRELERNPRTAAPERAVKLRESCMRACDDVHVNCQHRNCRAHPKDPGCLRQCASCLPGLCERAFSPYWAGVERSYLTCAGRQVSRDLVGLQGCVDRFIKDNGKDRLLDEALCVDGLREGFVDGHDACRDKACSASCQGPYSIFEGKCFCEE